MYWQVYLHKTAVAYEKVLVNMLLRAKLLARQGQMPFASPALAYFLQNDVDAQWFREHEEALQMYEELDDSDIWSAMKVWRHSPDKILSTLASDMLDRRIFRVEVSETPFSEDYVQELRCQIARAMDIPLDDTRFLMAQVTLSKDMYSPLEDSIDILYKDGTTRPITQASELLNVELLSRQVSKHYLCYQRV